MNVNKVIFAGRLTRDIELRSTQGGMVIGKLGLVSNRKFKDEEKACFIDCTAFGRQAEVMAEYLSKGDPVFIEGRLDYSTWEKDGVKKSKLEVVVENFQFVGGRDKGEEAGRSSEPARPAAGEPPSIPF